MTGSNGKRKFKWGLLVQRVLIYTLLVSITFLIVAPLLWMLSTSLKPSREWFMPEIRWIPITPTLENYRAFIDNRSIPIFRWFFNSLFIASMSTVLVLTVDSLAAYAYARLKFPGRQVIYYTLLGTLFLPGLMFLVPNFLLVHWLGILNTYWGVILPGLAGVFGIFFLRQFFEGIPKTLEEAAELDGANKFQIFYMIVLPLSKPALATLGILTFLASWNDFLWPLLILRDRNMQTLPPGLSTLQGAYTSDYGLIMAGAVIVAVPVLVLYVFLQRYIVESVATTGIK